MEGVALTLKLHKGALFKIIHNRFPRVYSELLPNASALSYKAKCIDLENIKTYPCTHSFNTMHCSVLS